MNISRYLDTTFLKTAEQAGISKNQTKQKIIALITEAIENNFKLVMIRPEYVFFAKKMILNANSKVLVGTVIGFHEGTKSIKEKLKEAQKAIVDSVDELDFVINYQAFLKGELNRVKSEVFKGSKVALENNKVIKWIIEIAALTDAEIVGLTQLIRDVVLDNFGEGKAQNVFVKSSTGFYNTKNGKPNGATFEGMKLIIENAKPLQSTAAGGVRSYEDAIEMIKIGVTRIGTSSAKKIISKQITEEY